MQNVIDKNVSGDINGGKSRSTCFYCCAYLHVLSFSRKVLKVNVFVDVFTMEYHVFVCDDSGSLLQRSRSRTDARCVLLVGKLE